MNAALQVQAIDVTPSGVTWSRGGAQERIRRASPNTSTVRQPRERIIDGLSIRDRLADVEDPATPDHWGGDLITGSQNTHISYFGGPSVVLHLFVKMKG